MQNNKSKLVLITTFILLLSSSSTIYAANANDEAPPSLTITPGDSEAPPSLNITSSSEDDNEAPPGLNITTTPDNPDQPPDNNGNSSGNSASNLIQITNVSVNPQKFNPTIDETRISYKLSKQAKVEVKILNSGGQTIATLVNNQNQSAATHNVNWFGTINNIKNGQMVHAAVYTYKITAKNVNSGVAEDTEQGQVEVFLPGVSTPLGPQSPQSPSTANQAMATVTLNNAKSGQTAATGPGIFIYPLIPLAVYFIRRKFRK